VSWGERVYELVVALYPRRFRHEYGPSLRQVFRELALDRAVPAWRLWLTVLGDLPGSLLREHYENLRGGDMRHGALLGLAMGLIWTAVDMVNQGVVMDDREHAILGAGFLAALVLPCALSGFLGARRNGTIGTGLTAALVTCGVGSALGVAAMWLATWIFYQNQLIDPGNIADFRRSGLPTMDAFLVDDDLRASIIGPAMALVIGAVVGTAGAALGSQMRRTACTIGP